MPSPIELTFQRTADHGPPPKDMTRRRRLDADSTPAGARQISTTGQIVEIPYNYNGFRFFFAFLIFYGLDTGWSRSQPDLDDQPHRRNTLQL